MAGPLLDVEGLTVVFEGARSRVTAVDNVSFRIEPGETLGLVGESGSGKAVTAFSILRLLQPPGRAGLAVSPSRSAISWGCRRATCGRCAAHVSR